MKEGPLTRLLRQILTELVQAVRPTTDRIARKLTPTSRPLRVTLRVVVAALIIASIVAAFPTSASASHEEPEPWDGVVTQRRAAATVFPSGTIADFVAQLSLRNPANTSTVYHLPAELSHADAGVLTSQDLCPEPSQLPVAWEWTLRSGPIPEERDLYDRLGVDVAYPLTKGFSVVDTATVYLPQFDRYGLKVTAVGAEPGDSLELKLSCQPQSYVEQLLRGDQSYTYLSELSPELEDMLFEALHHLFGYLVLERQ